MKRIIRFFKAVRVVYRDGMDIIFRDPLTNLYNRRFFQEVGLKMIEDARRYQRPLSIVLFDIDQFKKTNDTLGHSAGDRLLKTVAEEVIGRCRQADLIFRWGGDEFLMLLPGTSGKGADRLIKRIFRELCAKQIEISYGIVPWNQKFASSDEFIAEADQRLYRHKEKKGLRSRA